MFWRNETKIPTTFPVDPTVGVIRFDRADGKPLAILVHYSCHPVILGPVRIWTTRLTTQEKCATMSSSS